MTPQTTTPSGPAVSEGSTVSAASLAKIRALSASSDAVSGASSGGQGGKSICGGFAHVPPGSLH